MFGNETEAPHSFIVAGNRTWFLESKLSRGCCFCRTGNLLLLMRPCLTEDEKNPACCVPEEGSLLAVFLHQSILNTHGPRFPSQGLDRKRKL